MRSDAFVAILTTDFPRRAMHPEQATQTVLGAEFDDILDAV
jgi:hypothetical protein